MEKKLTAQGPKGRQSFTVTLPKEFVMQAGLDKKRSVDLEIVGNKAVISTYKDKAERVLVNGDEYAKNLIKVLQGLYRRGVGELKISYSESKIVEDIVEIVEQKLIGYEIVEQKKDYLIVKDITKESEEEFKTVFRRIFLLLMELSECEDLVQAKILDRNLKKLINYCQRILMKKGHIDFRKTPLYYLILDRLEKINDEFKWLLKLVIPKKEEVKKEPQEELKLEEEEPKSELL